MEVKMINMKDIVTNPLQPRQTFDREKLQELADSIREGELLQPIVVRSKGKKFEVVCGERRYKAFQILKEPHIPAIVRNIKDDMDALEKSLIENWQRVNLNTIEGENALVSLWDSKRYKTFRELSKKTGISLGTLSDILQGHEERKMFDIEQNKELSYDDFTRSRVLEEYPETRKKVLEKRANREIESQQELHKISKRLAEFDNPEQQQEELNRILKRKESYKEMDEHDYAKELEIAQGIRESEHIIEIETDTDQRLIDSYKQIKSNVFEIYYDHIQHMKSEKKKKEAIKIIWDIHNFTRKQLEKLNELKVI